MAIPGDMTQMNFNYAIPIIFGVISKIDAKFHIKELRQVTSK
jgi:hypothetical protein